MENDNWVRKIPAQSHRLKWYSAIKERQMCAVGKTVGRKCLLWIILIEPEGIPSDPYCVWLAPPHLKRKWSQSCLGSVKQRNLNILFSQFYAEYEKTELRNRIGGWQGLVGWDRGQKWDYVSHYHPGQGLVI